LVAEINLAKNVDEVKNFELRNDCSAKLEETAGLKNWSPKTQFLKSSGIN